MANVDLPSLVGLLIQALGILLVATLCLVLQNTVRRGALGYWTAGWFALAAAEGALFASFAFPRLRLLMQPIYLLGEYVFAYLLIAGCRRFSRGEQLKSSEAWLLAPAAFLAVFLPRIGGGDFTVLFASHSVIYAYLFVMAFRVLWRMAPTRGNVLGLRIVKIALLLLAVDYGLYASVIAAASYGLLPPIPPDLAYAPLYDLVLLVPLAFGLVILTTGEVQHELEQANARLAEARDRLEAMAQLDHLTSALNRHAFYSIIGESRAAGRTIFRGCAAVADIDNMKTINDRYGHAAGDVAIRAVAAAVRARIRADDLLFRWGGDEFLVLLFGTGEPEARAALDGVNSSLQQLAIAGVPEPVDVSISLGYAPFDSAASLDEVIARADTAMYGRKRTGA